MPSTHCFEIKLNGYVFKVFTENLYDYLHIIYVNDYLHMIHVNNHIGYYIIVAFYIYHGLITIHLFKVRKRFCESCICNINEISLIIHVHILDTIAFDCL